MRHEPGLVKAHGGRLWIESALGHGSTFSFTIPVTPRAEDHRPEAAPQAAEPAAPPAAILPAGSQDVSGPRSRIDTH